MFYGAEEFTEDDAAYRGSRFADVRDAVFADPYRQIWGREGQGPLPVYRVTLKSVLAGLFSLVRPYIFRAATARAVDSHADLRFGNDGRGFRRLLHPNGVVLTGLWEIDADTPYSGYFRKGSRALTIARYSTCCSETRRGHSRSLSMVGKLYPTADECHPTPLQTASFITQQDIGGDSTTHINDAVLLNAPNTTITRRGFGAPILLVTGIVFLLVDAEPSIRELYEIAELGKPAGEPTRAPRFMRLTVSSHAPRIQGAALDFRDEVMAHIYDAGDPTPKRKLVFDIAVTDDGETHGLPVFQRRTFRHWKHIGRLTFDAAASSYNGDFVLHFNHPTWRADRNDPATATRAGRRKVR